MGSRKRIGARQHKVYTNRIGMEINLNISLEVIEGDEIVVGGKVIGAKGNKDILFITPNTNKRTISKEIGVVCSKMQVVVVQELHKK